MALVDLKSDLAKNAGKNLSKISGRLNDPSLSDKQGKTLSIQPQFEDKSKNAKQFKLDKVLRYVEDPNDADERIDKLETTVFQQGRLIEYLIKI